MPVASQFMQQLQIDLSQPSVISFFKDSSLVFHVRLDRSVYKDRNKRERISKGRVHAYIESSNDFFAFSSLVLKLYERGKRKQKEKKVSQASRVNLDNSLREIFKSLGVQHNETVSVCCTDGKVSYARSKLPNSGGLFADTNDNNNEIKSAIFAPELDTLFEKTILYQFMDRHVKAGAAYILEQMKIEESLAKGIDDLFNEGVGAASG